MPISTGFRDYSRADINSTAQTACVTKNTGRNYLLIQNVSDVDIYVAFDDTASATVTTNHGSLKMVAGAVHEWIADVVPSGAITAKSASGSAKSIVIFEG